MTNTRITDPEIIERRRGARVPVFSYAAIIGSSRNAAAHSVGRQKRCVTTQITACVGDLGAKADKNAT